VGPLHEAGDVSAGSRRGRPLILATQGRRAFIGTEQEKAHVRSGRVLHRAIRTHRLE
jgi:hypothetical protein